MNLAVGKLPPLAPGEFRFVTKAIIPEGGDGERRRFRTVASSTTRDMQGDEMKISALQDMAQSFREGVPIFMDHTYKASPMTSFGMSDTADIRDSGLRHPKTGAPIYDLHVAGFVDEANPNAVQLHDSMIGGFKWGTSIGAFVTSHKKNAAGRYDIEHVRTKEASIVGIPMNERSYVQKGDTGEIVEVEMPPSALSQKKSWVAKAADAAARLDDAGAEGFLDEADDDSEPVEKKGVEGPITALGGATNVVTVAPIPPDSTQVLVDRLVSVGDVKVASGGSLNSGSLPLYADDGGSGGTQAFMEVTTATAETKPVVRLTTVKGDACPTCNKAEKGDCNDDYHTQKSADSLDTEVPLGDPTSEPSTDGQEAEGATPEPAKGQEAEGATPETASGEEAESDEEAQKGFAPDQVVALMDKVHGLVEEIGALREENAVLRSENVTLKGVQSATDAVAEKVEEIMGLPLQRKAVDMLSSLPERFPQMDPAIVKAIRRAEEAKK